MKKNLITTLFHFVCFSMLIASAQEFRGSEISFTVSNAAGRSQMLSAGIYAGATTGIDPSLSETELPPMPPAEIFDARMISTPGKSQLGQGSRRDYRSIASTSAPFTESYIISFQGGINTTSVKVAWASPYPSRITKLMIDGNDMTGKTELNSAAGVGQMSVQITYNFQPLSLAVAPLALAFAASNRGPLPMKTLNVTPQGDPNASWNITTDVDWLDIFPASGSGSKIIEVTMINQTLSAGNYSGNLTINALAEPVSVVVPVTLTMTVGVNDNLISASSITLSQSIPNPVSLSMKSNATAIIRLELRDGFMRNASPSLKVFDALGRLVADLSSQLSNERREQSIHLDVQRFSPGMYTYVLLYGNRALSRKMLVTQ